MCIIGSYRRVKPPYYLHDLGRVPRVEYELLTPQDGDPVQHIETVG